MAIRKVLRDLATAVADEAAQNPQFARRLGEILEPTSSPTRRRGSSRRPAHRRAPAVAGPCSGPLRTARMHSARSSRHWTSNDSAT